MLWPLDQRRGGPALVRRPHAGRAATSSTAFSRSLPSRPDPFPEELHMQKMCGVVWCCTGDREQAEAVFAPIARSARRRSTASRRSRSRRCRGRSTRFTRPGLSGTGRPTSSTSSPTRRSRARRARRAAADAGTRRCTCTRSTARSHRVPGRHGLGLPRFALGEVIVGVDPDPADDDAHHRLGARLLGATAPLFGRAAPT